MSNLSDNNKTKRISKDKQSKDKLLLNKKQASMVLGSYLDTLGFYNGNWEFNYNLKARNLKDAFVINYEIIHHFFALGGFNIDISRWNASDDTIMSIATMNACMKGGKLEQFINIYIDILPLLEDKKRASGITTINSLRILYKKRDVKTFWPIPYSDNMGGNGAAMRTSYIGIYFNNIKKIIEISIETSRLTHNYPLGFLGGMVTALFTNYALNNIDPIEWCDMLIELNNNGTIDTIVDKLPTRNFKMSQYNTDKDLFWDSWYKYKEYRISKYGSNSTDFLSGSDRINDLINIMYSEKQIKNESIDYAKMGATGSSATIFAYDSLLMSKKKEKYDWESLIFFSTLHFGDNDTIGAIAGNWFGALRGFTDIKNKNFYIDQLEFKKELIL